MNLGRKKTPLLLMEQLVMVLVFALSATFCIQAFVLSNQISKESQDKDRAVKVTQNIAESLIETKGDLIQLKQRFGGKIEKDTWRIDLNEDWTESGDTAFFISVKKKEVKGYLGETKVIVKNQEGSIFYKQDIAWQEVESGV